MKLKTIKINKFNFPYRMSFLIKAKYFLVLFLIALSFDKYHSEEISETDKSLISNNKSYDQTSFIAEALKKSGAAVVTIDTQRKIKDHRKSLIPPSLLIDPYFEKFFDLPNINLPQTRIERAQGSGVIFSSKGLVLTNAHVVANSDKLIVGLSDGRRVLGKVIGQDSLTDLAVIKLAHSNQWPKAVIGNSDEIEVGDWAIAVGNPYGLEKTVTLGIISNLNRNTSQLGIANNRVNLIQTDAAINPGNSGGPLLNSQGEVIGINTLIHSSPGAGLGFAIPINQAIAIAKELAVNGKVIHPMIGVSLSYIDSEEDLLSQKLSKGALIIHVFPGSPAAKEGLKVEDIIIAINQKEIQSPKDVIEAISKNGVKNKMKFKISRNNRIFDLLIKPDDLDNLKQVHQ